MAIEDYTENYTGLGWDCPHCGGLNSPDEDWTCRHCGLAPEMCRDCRRLDCQCSRWDEDTQAYHADRLVDQAKEHKT